MTSEEKEVCPLCMEPMEADDLAFYPCDCRYQVCRFCWAKIINEENGLCPACRKEYNSEKPALYKPISEAEDAKLRSTRKRKDHLKKTKLNAEMLKLLPELRVVQPNLIFVVGLPAWVCKDKEILKGPEYFGRYGKVFKVEINQNQTFGGPQGQPSFSAYITFCRAEDAMRSIKEWDQGMLHGRSLRVSLGTTKYCSQFLRGTKCTKHECMYLHELGDPAASFTKEEMQAGKHTEYMNKLLSKYTPTTVSNNGQGSMDSPNSYVAPSSSEDSQACSKDSSVHSSNRFRGRADLGSDRPSGSIPLKSTHGGHNRSLADSEVIPTTPLGEGRRTRVFHSDYTYSQFDTKESPTDPFSPSCDISSNKTNVWNRQLSADYLQTNSYKCATGKPPSSSFNHVYANGLDGGGDLDKCNRLSKNPNELRRIPSSEPPRAAAASAHRNKSSGLEAYQTPNVNTNCEGSPAEGSWFHSTPPTESTNHLSYGEDPVDIDFDPFLESQQGLAELLAAEVEKLRLINEDSFRNTYDVNGRSPGSGTCTAESRSQLLDVGPLDHSRSEYTSDHPRRTGYSWMSDFMSCANEGPPDLNQRNSQSLFPRIYPPPGFEDNARVLQQQTDSSVFPNAHLDPVMNFELSESLGGHRNNGVGSSSLPCGNGPIPNNNYSFAHVPCNLGNKLDTSFETFSQSKFSKSVDSASHYRSPSSSYVVPPENTLSFGTHEQAPQRPDSQQAIASLFNTAFNTASAMLNHRVAASGEKSTCTPASSASSFDLSTFFSHLCRHSPFFSSLAASDWSGVLGSEAGRSGTSNAGARSTVNSQDSLIDSTTTALAAAASILFPSVQFPPRSSDVLSTEDENSQINLNNYSFPPGLSKQMPVHHPQGLSEMHIDKSAFNCSSNPGVSSSSDPSASTTPVTWQLDDPAIVSSQFAPTDNSANFQQPNSDWKTATSTSSPAEILQQLWRSSSGLSPIFGSQLAPAFGLSSTNQTSVSAAPQRPLRDSSLQSASQPTE